MIRVTDKELLKQALDALVESYDDVVQEHENWMMVYGGLPTRAAQQAQGEKIVADHKAAIDALRARLAEPEVKRVPMDRAEVDAMLDKLPKGAVCLDIVRAVERHHGIE